MGDGQESARGVQHRTVGNAELLAARMGRRKSDEQRAVEPDFATPKQRKNLLHLHQLTVSHRLIGKIEWGTVHKNGYFYIPNVQFYVDVININKGNIYYRRIGYFSRRSAKWDCLNLLCSSG